MVQSQFTLPQSMRLFERNGPSEYMLHSVRWVNEGKVVGVDAQALVAVTFNHRQQLALHVVEMDARPTDAFLLIGEISDEADKLSWGWSIQCREEAAQVSVKELREHAEEQRQAAYQDIMTLVRPHLRPKLTLVA